MRCTPYITKVVGISALLVLVVIGICRLVIWNTTEYHTEHPDQEEAERKEGREEPTDLLPLRHSPTFAP